MNELHCKECSRHAACFGIIYSSKESGIPFCHDCGTKWLHNTSVCPQCGGKKCKEKCGYTGSLDRGLNSLVFDRWPIWCNNEDVTFPIWDGRWPGKDNS